MIIRICIAIATAICSTYSISHALEQNRILNIRHWTAPDHTRVVIDTVDDIHYTVEKGQRKVQIYFKKTDYFKNLPHEISLAKPAIDKVSVTSLPGGDLNVELSVSENADTNIFTLKKIGDKPYRVVIDVALPGMDIKEGREREQVKVATKSKVIVIDPGHGGEDPGAIGRHHTMEKEVVLEISKKLRNLINKKRGYRAFLTRDGDYYVPFKKRLRIAREYGADLFISIHADAFRKRNARGSSVYCLSLSGASTEAAKFLARQENLSDIIGGAPNGETNEDSDLILLNMFQTNTINASKIFGINVLKHLDQIGNLKFSQVQEAQFRVLKLPEIPSVLVETAYISNPKEERLLKTNRYQMKIARAIAAAVYEFLPLQTFSTPEVIIAKHDEKEAIEKPETKGVLEVKEVESLKGVENKSEDKNEKTALHAEYEKGKQIIPVENAEKLKETKKIKTISYKVIRGDSLEKIALKHDTTIGVLLKLNNMKKDDPLYYGRKIRLPGRDLDQADFSKKDSDKIKMTAKGMADEKLKQHTYKVKKGDTWNKISQKYNMTIPALLKLNHMKSKEKIVPGMKIKVIAYEKELRAKTRKVASSAFITYKVKKGDTLEKIAKKYKTNIDEIKKLNGIKKIDVLYYNQELKLPSRTDS